MPSRYRGRFRPRMLIDDGSDQRAAELIGQRVSTSGHHRGSDRRPASDLVETICSFLNLRTADPSISEKIFGPENTAILCAIPARRTRRHSFTHILIERLACLPK